MSQPCSRERATLTGDDFLCSPFCTNNPHEGLHTGITGLTGRRRYTRCLLGIVADQALTAEINKQHACVAREENTSF